MLAHALATLTFLSKYIVVQECFSVVQDCFRSRDREWMKQSCDIVQGKVITVGIEEVFQFLYNFGVYVYSFLSTVPLSVSLGSAVLVTFVWLLNEVTGLLLFWRAVVVTVWGFLLVDVFIPIGDLAPGQLWAFLILVIGVGIIVTRLTKMKRRKLKCPKCGTVIR